MKSIKLQEEQLLNSILHNLIFPKLTYNFSFDANQFDFQNRFGQAVKKLGHKFIDEKGNPVEGGVLKCYDTYPDNNDKPYSDKPDKNGEVISCFLNKIEKIVIVNEKLHITNLITKEYKEFDIDVIIYISFDACTHRLIFIMPLIGEIQIGWPGTPIDIKQSDFLTIVQKHLPEFAITELKNYYQNV